MIRLAHISIEVVRSGVCLGRTAGFRRSAVDSALESAIREGL